MQWLYESKVSKTGVWETGTSTSEEGAFQPVSRKVETPWVKTNERHIFWLATSPLPLTLDYNIILLPSIGVKPEYISFKPYNNVCLVKMQFLKNNPFFLKSLSHPRNQKKWPLFLFPKRWSPHQPKVESYFWKICVVSVFLYLFLLDLCVNEMASVNQL